MSRINDVMEGLQSLIQETLRATFAPAECGCSRNPWDPDPAKMPAEATPYVWIDEGRPRLMGVGNGWPRWRLSVTLWVEVKTTGETADDGGVRVRANVALETLTDALIGNLTLNDIAVNVRPDGDPEPAFDLVEGSWRIPLTLEIARA